MTQTTYDPELVRACSEVADAAFGTANLPELDADKMADAKIVAVAYLLMKRGAFLLPDGSLAVNRQDPA